MQQIELAANGNSQPGCCKAGKKSKGDGRVGKNEGDGAGFDTESDEEDASMFVLTEDGAAHETRPIKKWCVALAASISTSALV